MSNPNLSPTSVVSTSRSRFERQSASADRDGERSTTKGDRLSAAGRKFGIVPRVCRSLREVPFPVSFSNRLKSAGPIEGRQARLFGRRNHQVDA